MNTCAECRFWERSPFHADVGECQLTIWSDIEGHAHPASKAKAHAGGHEPDSAALETRSDFGCVQFERLVDLKGIPVALNVFDRETTKPINALDIDLHGLTDVEITGDSRSVTHSSVALRFGKHRRITLFTDDRPTFDALATWASRLLTS